jgi:hypothetical protein
MVGIWVEDELGLQFPSLTDWNLAFVTINKCWLAGLSLSRIPYFVRQNLYAREVIKPFARVCILHVNFNNSVKYKLMIHLK